jgi:hypothetical protein
MASTGSTPSAFLLLRTSLETLLLQPAATAATALLRVLYFRETELTPRAINSNRPHLRLLLILANQQLGV